MTPNLVSTIIPVYNRPEMLREAVTSVISQTHRPLEVVIVNDGSTDGTAQLADALTGGFAPLVRVIHQQNAGSGAARNVGLRQARGEFIQYLDSDDVLEPRKFELQVAALRDNGEAGVCYSITLRRHPKSGELQPWARTAERIECPFPEFLMKRGWDTNSPLWRRSVCDLIGPWSDFRVLEDWEHDLRAGMLGVKTAHVAEPLAVVRDHEGNRASGMTTGFTPELTRDFFRAHRSIYEKMRERGLLDWSYLESFSRKMFWIARMCGARGLLAEADAALEMAEEMVATKYSTREIRVFRWLTRAIGWRRAVWLSESARKIMRWHTNPTRQDILHSSTALAHRTRVPEATAHDELCADTPPPDLCRRFNGICTTEVIVEDSAKAVKPLGQAQGRLQSASCAPEATATETG